jgi:putative spermidine/putrescine transport system permease protein
MSAARWGPRLAPLLMTGIPLGFLLLAFVLPNAFLLTASFLKSESQILTDEITLDNYRFIFGQAVYLRAIGRSFTIGASVAALVVLASYPLAFFLARTQSRWRGVLISLSLSPLLASVVVRTYGWWVLMNREGAINDLLRGLRVISEPLALLPSSGAIVVGLTHSLLPYGVLTILSSLNGVNPSFERAAMSLGATRTRTFLEITLPLSMPGIVGAFVIAFTLSISAYATPAILGGPSTATMATLIYEFMTSLADWAVGSALGAVLIVTSMALLVLGAVLGSRRASL